MPGRRGLRNHIVRNAALSAIAWTILTGVSLVWHSRPSWQWAIAGAGRFASVPLIAWLHLGWWLIGLAIMGVATWSVERRRAEWARSEARFRVLFETSRDALMTVTPAGWTFINANRAAVEMFGLADESRFTAFSPGDLSPEVQPDGRPSADKAREMAAIALREGSHSFQWTHRRLNGEDFPAAVLLARVEVNGETFIQGTVRDITEQLRAEERLRQGEALQRQLVDNVNAGVVIIDAETRLIERVNPAAASLLGAPAEQIAGLSCRHVLCPSRGGRCPAAELGCEVENEEASLLRPGGGSVPVLKSVKRIRIGGAEKFLETYVDISARKRAEDALRKGEGRLRALITTMPDIVWLKDPDGVYLSCNPRFEQFFGASERDIAGKTDYDFVDRELADFFRANDRAAIAAGKPVINEEEVRFAADGHRELLETIKTPVYDSSGGLIGVLGIARDITARNRDQARLLEMANRLSLATKASGIGIWEYDTATQTISWDDRLAGLYGLFNAAGSGHYSACVDALHPEDRVRIGREFQRALDGTQDFDTEFRLVRADGNVIYGRATAVVQRDAEGRALCIVGTNADVTAWREAAARVARSEQRFRRLFEAAPIGICISDLNGVRTAVNRAFCTMVGYREEELLNGAWAEISVDDTAPSRDMTDQLLQSPDTVFEGEHRYRHRDGSLLWLRVKTALVRDADGETLYIVSHFENVTDRRNALQAVANSEARFRRMFEDNGSVMLLVEPISGVITDANQAAADYYGYSRQQLIGMEIVELNILDPAFVASQRHRVMRERQVRLEFRHRLASGEVRDVDVYSTSIDLGGRPELLSIVVDVTETKRAEARLRALTDRLMLATHAGGVGIWEWDVVNQRLEWDDQVYQLYGVSREQFRDASEAWRAGLIPEDRERVDAVVERALSGESQVDVEYRVVWPDRSVHYIRALAMVQRNAAGRPTHVIGTNWDITAQKLAAEDLRESNRRLEESTALSRRLASEAERANAAKSEFLANMSHEIRTPMNGVIGMMGLLMETDLSPKQRRYAEIVQSSGDNLLRIINDILDFAKVEAGKLELDTEAFDLSKLLDDLAVTFSAAAREKNLAFVSECDPTVPPLLMGDPGRLRQVLVNLLGNAIKFTSQGHVAVRTAAVGQNADHVLLRFSVQDTGGGIPIGKVGFLFNKFTQVDGSTTRKHGGTGLGLAISKQIVELMGGEIGVVSEEGKGSDFWFTARFATQSEPAAQNPWGSHPISARPATGHWQPRQARILLAEDNAVNEEVALGMLAHLGLQADVARNGIDAVRALGTVPYDLVLMDVHMPKMDGLQATRTIRDPRTAVLNHEIPIIAMTASAMQKDKAECMEAGMNGYVTKPVSSHALEAALEAWLPVVEAAPQEAPTPAPEIRTEPVWDREELMSRLADYPDLAQRIMQAFVDDVPHQLEALRAALEAADVATARRVAHSIKGASANVAGERLRRTALAMEMDAKAGDLALVVARREQLESDFAELKAVMLAEL